MFSGIVGTFSAFFRGLLLLSRESALAKLSRHKNILLCSVFALVYYSVQFLYFGYHGKAVPREHVSDYMVLVFQLAQAPVIFAGFYQVVLFMSREDVQRALGNAVATCVRFLRAVQRVSAVVLRFAGDVLRVMFRGVVAFGVFSARWLGRMTGAFVRVSFHVLVVAFAVSVEGYRWSKRRLVVTTSTSVRTLKHFSTQCVEAGQRIES